MSSYSGNYGCAALKRYRAIVESADTTTGLKERSTNHTEDPVDKTTD